MNGVNVRNLEWGLEALVGRVPDKPTIADRQRTVATDSLLDFIEELLYILFDINSYNFKDLY